MLIADDLDNLLNILPDFVKEPLFIHENKKFLIEIVMDLGRRPEARFPNGPEYLSTNSISWHDLDFCIKKIPQFSGDNRSGIECTLHRISSIKNRKGNIIGLTFRVGRAIFGTIGVIRDLLYSKKSLLLLGKPGVGKTTAIREITRVLSDEMQKRVVIIDTSNEIAGDGDIPHPAIGRARRMQVTKPEMQHQVMIEAVENHMPEVIIIDEIGTELEALAARTIAERGVQLVGTAHGNSLDNLIKNPILSDLVGGVQYVTLGDDEAKKRGSQKSIIERKALPAFQVAIEVSERGNWIIHENVDQSIDIILQGSPPFLQRRKVCADGSISIKLDCSYDTNFIYKSNFAKETLGSYNIFLPKEGGKINLINKFTSLSVFKYTTRLHNGNTNNVCTSILYLYGINIQRVESCIKQLNLPLSITRDLVKADYILALKSTVKYSGKIRQVAKLKKIVIYTINNHTIQSINKALKQISSSKKAFLKDWYILCQMCKNNELQAIIETRYAIEKIVLFHKQSVQLLYRQSNYRSLQFKLLKLYNLSYEVIIHNNFQELVIYPH
uniref:AAA+ ATPase domain-containing protein n=1 Tax=Polysiphonia sertularioides TaxID=945028 RepID=A0A1Z1M9U3_9FLOR|nr:hypothetical protein [Polysiphonia sertularioides]ARW62514.1 hypothetical protein [Polysiphonia sertularioides]